VYGQEKSHFREKTNNLGRIVYYFRAIVLYSLGQAGKYLELSLSIENPRLTMKHLGPGTQS
jgi:hypothetical protein